MKNELGEKLRILRNNKNISQEKLGKVLNLSRSQISNLEKGNRNLSIKQINKICEYFNVDITYFIYTKKTDESIDFLEKAKYIFSSDKLTDVQKEEIFTTIMRYYLDSRK